MDSQNDWIVDDGRMALDLDGSDDYMVIANNNALQNFATFSLAGWFKATSATNFHGLMNKFEAGSYPYYWYVKNTGVLSIFVNGVSVDSTITVTFGQWQHWSASFDGSSARFTIGNLVESVALAATAATNTSPVHIGSQFAGERYKGLMDDLAVYDHFVHLSILHTRVRHRGIAYETRERRARSAAAARIPRGATMTGGMYVNQTGGMVA